MIWYQFALASMALLMMVVGYAMAEEIRSLRRQVEELRSILKDAIRMSWSFDASNTAGIRFKEKP